MNQLTLRLQKKNIYNNFTDEIVEIKGENVVMKSGIKLSTDQIEKFFIPAYARTLYGIQGKSLKSYHYAPEDYKFLNGRSAYTVVSRLTCATSLRSSIFELFASHWLLRSPFPKEKHSNINLFF